MINFVKMQGTGNNYVYIDCIKYNLKKCDFSKLSQQMSDVNYGIGADGIILICKSLVADVKMIMYNKDGSEGKMCGNGIRCVGRYIYDNYFKKKELTVETKSGVKKLQIVIDNNVFDGVIVDMGYPIFEPVDIPVNISGKNIINRYIKIQGLDFNINCVSMGNPHIVLFLKNIDNIDIQYLGELIQNSGIFPQGCNVEFVEIINRNKIKMRVYERGSGETLSCGTGACASVVMGVLNDLLNYNNEIEVVLKGGHLYILYNDKVYMKGSAEYICKGKYLVRK